MSQPQQKDGQNKRRRFAPNTLPQIPAETNPELALLYSMCDESPSQHELEAQLLQVGMRVRKAVAEGYQIPGKRTFMPRPFFNSNRLSPATISALSGEEACDVNAKQPLSTATFCGISLAALAHVSSAPIIEEQKLWSYSTASKRRQHFDDESDSDDSQEFMPRTPELGCADAGVGFPQDYFYINLDNDFEPVFEEPQSRLRGRKIAQPKLRKTQAQPCTSVNPFAKISSFQQQMPTFGHQRMGTCGMDAIDFPEASFLQPRHDVEMDCS